MELPLFKMPAIQNFRHLYSLGLVGVRAPPSPSAPSEESSSSSESGSPFPVCIRFLVRKCVKRRGVRWKKKKRRWEGKGMHNETNNSKKNPGLFFPCQCRTISI